MSKPDTDDFTLRPTASSILGFALTRILANLGRATDIAETVATVSTRRSLLQIAGAAFPTFTATLQGSGTGAKEDTTSELTAAESNKAAGKFTPINLRRYINASSLDVEPLRTNTSVVR